MHAVPVTSRRALAINAWPAATWMTVLTGEQPFTVIIDQYPGIVQAIVRKTCHHLPIMDAEDDDLLSDAWLHLHTNIVKINGTRLEQCDNPTAFVFAWIARVIWNLRIDALRRILASPLAQALDIESVAIATPFARTPNDDKDDAERRSEIAAALRTLNKESRQLITLTLTGATVDQIAEQMKVSRQTAYRIRKRALAALGERLNESGSTP